MKPETECFLVRKHAEKLYEERQEFPLLMFRRFLPFQAHGIRKTFNCSRQCTKSTEAWTAFFDGAYDTSNIFFAVLVCEEMLEGITSPHPRGTSYLASISSVWKFLTPIFSGELAEYL